MTARERLAAWRHRRRLRAKPEQLLEPVGDTPVFPAVRPMRVRGYEPYPERKAVGGRPLSDTRRARAEMHAQIQWHLTEKATRKK